MKKRRVLLIGGAGFIGHHMALKLAELKYNVEIIDSLQINNLFQFENSTMKNKSLYLKFLNQRLDYINKSNIPLHTVDARDYKKLESLFEKINPNIVIHFAAVSHAGKSNKQPYDTFDHSFVTLENALDISRESVSHFIYFSSSMVYGNFTKRKVNEETRCNPLGIYGALKYAGEKIVIAYNQVFNLPYTIVRPSALYGERCVSRRVGQIFIESALNDEIIKINGKGTDRLDFTYIGDLIQGVVNVIENDNSKNQIFNLTYGEARSLNDLISVLKTEFPNVEILYMPKDNLTPERGTLSVEKAKRMIGYKPKFSIEKGYINYIRWYKFLNNIK